jgi:hypothetical protein
MKEFSREEIRNLIKAGIQGRMRRWIMASEVQRDAEIAAHDDVLATAEDLLWDNTNAGAEEIAALVKLNCRHIDGRTIEVFGTKNDVEFSFVYRSIYKNECDAINYGFFMGQIVVDVDQYVDRYEKNLQDLPAKTLRSLKFNGQLGVRLSLACFGRAWAMQVWNVFVREKARQISHIRVMGHAKESPVKYNPFRLDPSFRDGVLQKVSVLYHRDPSAVDVHGSSFS